MAFVADTGVVVGGSHPFCYDEYMNSMKPQEVIAAAEHLSAEDRVTVVDSLLKTLDPPDDDIDREWLAVARKRMREIDCGEAGLVPGEVVFARLKERLQK